MEDPEKDDTIIESNNIYLKTLQKDKKATTARRGNESNDSEKSSLVFIVPFVT